VGFVPLERQPDLPALELRVLDRWKQRDVFRRSLEAREGAELFVFYEGPPTANGRPGVHHVEARAFKDVFPRYRTMKGYRAPRMAGWDCHGIPVEVEVEKELGFRRKQDIEEFGVAAFNARCRASVQRYVDDWLRLTERIAFWVDTDHAYWTMAPSYIDSVWWSLAQLWDRGLIYQDQRVVPYCPRCGTTLSDHEVAQGYRRTDDPSVFVRFPVIDGPLAAAGAALLVWTTTPWTLLSNAAAAIGPGIDYVLARVPHDGALVVIADVLVDTVLGEGTERVRAVSHAELVGAHYRPPFDVGVAPAGGTASAERHYVVSADFVTTQDGTGIVHIAPAFGADDMAVGREHGLPVVNPVDGEGRFVAAVTDFAGEFVKDADAGIVARLRERDLLVRAGTYTHDYPFCWRCGTPLLYYAKPSWYIATSRHRDGMLAQNATVDWHPEHVRDGRYGDWLAHNIDWNVSRERYWGTPLPLWRCDACGDVTAVGSRAQLGTLAGRDLSDLDPHRPHVDEVTFACTSCEHGTRRRVPEVIDAWYDSGAMPFAQFGHPWVAGSAELFAQRFPADFICEALDQTRGWFYSLMAESVLLFGTNSYRAVLCLGLIVDDDGRKMSKSQGNIIDPWTLIDRYGADALRWQLLTDGSPWINRRVGDESVGTVVRRFLLTLWNTAAFFTTYAALDGWTPSASSAPPAGERDVMDRWVLAELADTVDAVDAALWRYDTTAAGARLNQFTDDLSNWYVRRSRRRFWSAGAADSPDRDAAFATLHACLATLVTLLAPLTPFIADELHERLVRAVDPSAPDSVHLCDFPQARDTDRDDALRAAMRRARRLATLGLAARNAAGIGTRQPLARGLVTMPDTAGWAEIAGVIADELNVKAIEVPASSADTLTIRLKPDFRALGPAFGKDTPAVASAIAAASAEEVAARLRAAGHTTLTVGGQPVTVTAEQVQIIEEPRVGWTVASDAGYSVALDTAIDGGLRREGLARELVRALNDLRRRLDLALDQRIRIRISTDDDLRAALAAHRRTIATEVLATDIEPAEVADGADLMVAGHPVRVQVEPVDV
jgi:isoleucyl-tRNA synthetase